jgi:hypothetical protein
MTGSCKTVPKSASGVHGFTKKYTHPNALPDADSYIRTFTWLGKACAEMQSQSQ